MDFSKGIETTHQSQLPLINSSLMDLCLCSSKGHECGGTELKWAVSKRPTWAAEFTDVLVMSKKITGGKVPDWLRTHIRKSQCHPLPVCRRWPVLITFCGHQGLYRNRGWFDQSCLRPWFWRRCWAEGVHRFPCSTEKCAPKQLQGILYCVGCVEVQSFSDLDFTPAK